MFPLRQVCGFVPEVALGAFLLHQIPPLSNILAPILVVLVFLIVAVTNITVFLVRCPFSPRAILSFLGPVICSSLGTVERTP